MRLPLPITSWMAGIGTLREEVFSLAEASCACRVCLAAGKPCPSLAASPEAPSGGGGATGGAAASPGAGAVDTAPPVITVGDASCSSGGTASNSRAATAGGTEVVLTTVPVGEKHDAFFPFFSRFLPTKREVAARPLHQHAYAMHQEKASHVFALKRLPRPCLLPPPRPSRRLRLSRQYERLGRRRWQRDSWCQLIRRRSRGHLRAHPARPALCRVLLCCRRSRQPGGTEAAPCGGGVPAGRGRLQRYQHPGGCDRRRRRYNQAVLQHSRHVPWPSGGRRGCRRQCRRPAAAADPACGACSSVCGGRAAVRRLPCQPTGRPAVRQVGWHGAELPGRGRARLVCALCCCRPQCPAYAAIPMPACRGATAWQQQDGSLTPYVEACSTGGTRFLIAASGGLPPRLQGSPGWHRVPAGLPVDTATPGARSCSMHLPCTCQPSNRPSACRPGGLQHQHRLARSPHHPL